MLKNIIDDTATLLVVDDETLLSAQLIRVLNKKDPSLKIHSASNATTALEIAERSHPHVALVDLSICPQLGAQSGLELIAKIKSLDPTIRILALTGQDPQTFGLQAIQSGAASFIEKPASPELLYALVKDGISYSKLRKAEKKTPLLSNRVFSPFFSKNREMSKAIEDAQFAADTKQAVLILGATGTGKSMLARAIHNASEQAANQFVSFIPSFNSADLTNSQLFGHKKGSFTGALDSQSGLLSQANKGTLFIDEIDKLKEETQISLLQCLQEKTYRPLGSSNIEFSDFRLISASNEDATTLVSKQALREDFFHRVAHIIIKLPSLSQRREDIPELAARLFEKIICSEKLMVQFLSTEVVTLLSTHSLPGNIRQLESALKQATLRAEYRKSLEVELRDIQPALEKTDTRNLFSSQKQGLREEVHSFEQSLAEKALIASGFNKSRAAKELKIDRKSLQRILDR